MFYRRTSPVLALLPFLALAACDQSEPTASTLPEGSLAVLSRSGNTVVSGHVKGADGQLGLKFEQFSFTAVQKANGSVRGEWQVMDLDGGTIIAHGDVTCFAIEPDGKTARIGGLIEGGNTPPFTNPGNEANWTVRDNGEGANSPTDMGTDLTFGFSAGSSLGGECHCDLSCGFNPDGSGFTNIPLTPISAGNIQVR
jgi:hypothetical protein